MILGFFRIQYLKHYPTPALPQWTRYQSLVYHSWLIQIFRISKLQSELLPPSSNQTVVSRPLQKPGRKCPSWECFLLHVVQTKTLWRTVLHTGSTYDNSPGKPLEAGLKVTRIQVSLEHCRQQWQVVRAPLHLPRIRDAGSPDV